jgi:NAD(P)H-flavin reductase
LQVTKKDKSLREEAIKLFSQISKTHSYWGRKPLLSILEVLRELKIKKGDILLDPFCGGGTSVLAALVQGARVIASDLNPMAVFLTEVLIRPLNIATLEYFYQCVEQDIKDKILELYKVKCPICKNDAIIDYVVWEGKKENTKPVKIKLDCPVCGKRCIDTLKEKVKIKRCSYETTAWYPKSKIKSKQKTEVKFHYQLFTRRNLKALSLLLSSISRIRIGSYKNALQYIFTSILSDCSEMGRCAEKYISDSSVFQTLLQDLPEKRKENNVWYVFSASYYRFTECKKYLYDLFPELTEIRITASERKFYRDHYDLLIKQSDIFHPSYRLTTDIKYCFLDPLYNMDIEYLNFSQFWGSWLKMKFPVKNDFLPVARDAMAYFNIVSNMLQSVIKNSNRDIIIILAPGLKLKNKDDQVNEWIKDTGLYLCKIISNGKDNFYILSKQHAETVQLQKMNAAEIKNKYIDYCRAGAFLYYGNEKIKLKNIETLVPGIIPAGLHEALPSLSTAEIKEAIKDSLLNRRCYHSLCLALLDIIVISDHLKYSYINKSLFETSFIHLPHVDAADMIDELPDAAFMVTDHHTDFIFCFSDQDKDALKRIIEKLNQLDKNEFKKIFVLIERTENEMREERKIQYADQWKRIFFTSFDQIRDRAEKIDSTSFQKLCAKRIKQQAVFKKAVQGVNSYYAEVLENIPVGRSKDPDELKHYKLRFRVENLSRNILPGQFIMIDTIPLDKKTIGYKSARSANIVHGTISKDIFSTAADPYLLRPFGIHRAYYQHFEKDYLKKIKLPENLALILNMVYPYEFDIFYKVLEKGVGTKNLTRLKPSLKGIQKSGDIIRIIAPLGSRYNLKELREKGIEEVHVIGGGVGMAPLIFLIQYLRFFSFKIKAFVGISSIEFIKYADDYYKHSFVAQTRDARIYYDDLIDIGLSEDDIYISCEKETGDAQGIKNVFFGNIADYYRDVLSGSGDGNKRIAFSCGSTLMLQAVNKICREYNIPLKVLLEKRMACGIGVCFSCVCQVRDQSGNYYYSKVCMDGPIYNAEDVKELNDE